VQTIIEARGISRDYGSLRALDRLQFEVAKGQCVGIAGGVGSGKTTLIRLLGGLIAPTAGDLYVLELNTRTNAKAVRERVGILPERDGLDMDLSVLDNLLVFGRYFGLSGGNLRSRAKDLLRHVQLDEAEDWPTVDLRRGQARRLALARALIATPDVLLLDSPARDLPATERPWIWNAIERQKQNHAATIVASRDLDELERLCDRVIILDKGKISCQGKPQALVEQHVGRDVVEYDISTSELDYHLQALGGKFQFQVVANRLKIFVPENVDTMTAMRWVPSDRVVYRRAKLKDVYTKVLGHDIVGGPP